MLCFGHKALHERARRTIIERGYVCTGGNLFTCKLINIWGYTHWATSLSRGVLKRHCLISSNAFWGESHERWDSTEPGCNLS